MLRRALKIFWIFFCLEYPWICIMAKENKAFIFMFLFLYLYNICIYIYNIHTYVHIYSHWSKRAFINSMIWKEISEHLIDSTDNFFLQHKLLQINLRIFLDFVFSLVVFFQYSWLIFCSPLAMFDFRVCVCMVTLVSWFCLRSLTIYLTAFCFI